MSVDTRTMTLADTVRPRARGLLWDAVLVVAFGTLMGLVAQISIPLPFTPVPITGQTFGVLLTGAVLGSRRACAAMLVYLAEGLGGLPVFALGHSGPTVLLAPTGGYLLSFPFAAFAVGFLAERSFDRTFWRAVVAMVVGDMIIFAIGLPWLGHFVGIGNAVPLGLMPFIPGEIVKLLVAAAVLPSAWALVHRTTLPTSRDLGPGGTR
jgi:biotin transport system substrate-specific component